MSRRFLHWFAAAALVVAYGHAFAAVDVNAADEAALLSIKGIGPAKARAILDERATGGLFADAANLAQRVKGLGGHTVKRLRAEGLEIGAPARYMPAGRLVAARVVPRAQAHPATVALRGTGEPSANALIALHGTGVGAKAPSSDRHPRSTAIRQ